MRVEAAAEAAGLQLRPRSVRVFDEVVDIVNFDLVIVLDHFDHTEVLQPALPDHISYVYLMLNALHRRPQMMHCLRIGSLLSGTQEQNGIQHTTTVQSW